MLDTKKFQKRKENFICANCGYKVIGTGYTDHCPKCLASKHVDINPGDRLSECHGMMKPVSISTKKDGYIIFYKCEVCGFKHNVKSATEDDFETILALTNLNNKN